MVDPISDAERSAFNRRVIAATTLLVGGSAGLITLQVDTTLLQTAGAVAFGLVVGYALALFVVPTGPAPADRQRRRRARENPFADGGDGADDGDGVDDGDRMGHDGGRGGTDDSDSSGRNRR